MDHKLAIVILPRETVDPVRSSAAMLDRFQRVPLDASATGFEQKFRYKRVGGWFDGLAAGQVGQQRWSTVLGMLLEGTETNVATPFPGFGPETGAEIESRIEAGNTRLLADISPLAPCSIIVTPDGEWLARPDPDRTAASELPEVVAAEDLAWENVKRGVFEKHAGSMAVAWDLSWHFIAAPAIAKATAIAPAKAWGAKSAGGTRVESWAARMSTARRISAERAEESSEVTEAREAVALAAVVGAV